MRKNIYYLFFFIFGIVFIFGIYPGNLEYNVSLNIIIYMYIFILILFVIFDVL